MTELGNELVNGILEAKVEAMSTKKPTPQSSRYIVLILMVLCLFCAVLHFYVMSSTRGGVG